MPNKSEDVIPEDTSPPEDAVAPGPPPPPITELVEEEQPDDQEVVAQQSVIAPADAPDTPESGAQPPKKEKPEIVLLIERLVGYRQKMIEDARDERDNYLKLHIRRLSLT
ncbi:hypothetical protein GCK72_016004 [Caenorhabditis remanei]|uniref:Uncharacterized protein n=1 Tax=Caenorhabditis remanei TaxID=31234 RepID=A0A6A5GWI4_CAERE|nr:hypothetical protein GCK72_016004 [Caenorhabditis remanei]KAF1759537.1 hypothetical protein GCK72_016004 [Caenorhabditis remanei]